jgi:hypothetical protein
VGIRGAVEGGREGGGTEHRCHLEYRGGEQSCQLKQRCHLGRVILVDVTLGVLLVFHRLSFQCDAIRA